MARDQSAIFEMLKTAEHLLTIGPDAPFFLPHPSNAPDVFEHLDLSIAVGFAICID
jgi:hypothetical protein